MARRLLASLEICGSCFGKEGRWIVLLQLPSEAALLNEKCALFCLIKYNFHKWYMSIILFVNAISVAKLVQFGLTIWHPLKMHLCITFIIFTIVQIIVCIYLAYFLIPPSCFLVLHYINISFCRHDPLI